MLPDDTKLLPESIVTSQEGPVQFKGRFHKKCLRVVHPCYECTNEYRKISDISCTLVGDNIVYHSDVVGAVPTDVVGALPVGAAPTT